jgi:hypothetical protein
MRDDVGLVAGGAATPHRLMMTPQQATAGDMKLASDVARFQPRALALLAARIAARHRLVASVAFIYAENMLGGADDR